MAGDAQRRAGAHAASSIRRLVVKNQTGVGRLRPGGGGARAVTIGAGFTDALCHGVAFKSGLVAIGAIAAPSLASRDVNQMELIFQTELRDEAGQFLAPPFGLRDAFPRPPPVDQGITEGPAVWRLQRAAVERRNESTSIAMAADAGDIRDQGRTEIAPAMFAMTIHALQRGFQMPLRNLGIERFRGMTAGAVLIHRSLARMTGRAGSRGVALCDRRDDRNISARVSGRERARRINFLESE